MNQRPVVHHSNHCYHEAGHAVAFWHFGIEIVYVRITPGNPRHTGETKTVPHQLSNLAQIENEMQCVAAGYIAQRMLYKFPEELSSEGLIKCFKRNESIVTADPNPTSSDGDGPWFAQVGALRDKKIRETMPETNTGAETWLPSFRDAEHLMDELRPAVEAVANELIHNRDALSNEKVNELATGAMENAGN